MRRLHSLLTLFFGAALLLTLPACDSSSDGGGDGGGGGNGGGNGGGGNGSSIGTVSVTVSGDYEESFSGSAFFTVDDDDDFSLGLIGGTIFQTGTSQVVAFGRSGGRPANGDYSFGNDSGDFDGGYTDLENTNGNPLNATFIEAEDGTVTITSSSDDRVAGSFSFTGTVISATNPTGSGTATVMGTFTADFIDPDDAPDTGGL